MQNEICRHRKTVLYELTYGTLKANSQSGGHIMWFPGQRVGMEGGEKERCESKVVKF